METVISSVEHAAVIASSPRALEPAYLQKISSSHHHRTIINIFLKKGGGVKDIIKKKEPGVQFVKGRRTVLRASFIV